MIRGRRKLRFYGKKHDNHSKSKTQVETSRILGGAVVVDKQRVRLPFRFSTNDSVVSGAIDAFYFKLNSIFDCADASGAQNAQGYARYYNLYTRSIARASSINARIVSCTTGMDLVPQPIQLCVIPATAIQRTALNGMTDWSAFLQQPHAKSSMFVPGEQLAHVKHYMHVQTLYSGTDGQDLASAGLGFAGQTGTDPTVLMSWCVFITNPVSSATALDYILDLEINYYTEFVQPIVNTAQQLLTEEGNDFGGTPEEYKEYQKTHSRPVVVKNKKKEESKTPTIRSVQEPEYELVRVPLSRSKK